MVLTRAARRARRSAEQLTLDMLGEDTLGLVVQGLASPRGLGDMLLISGQDYASVAATCTVLRHACSPDAVLRQLALPVAIVPRAVLARLHVAANPCASFRLGLLEVYKEKNLPEGLRLLRLAAAAGLPEASWELYLLLQPANSRAEPPSMAPGEREAMLQAALAAGHKGAIVETAPHDKKAKRLRESFDFPLQQDARRRITIQDAYEDSIETQAAAQAAIEWLECDDAFVTLEDEGLATACWARHMPGQRQLGCHRFKYRTSERRDQRRRRALGLPESAELPQGPVKLRKCNQCFRAFYCSPLCQVLHWPDHKLACAPP